MSKDKNKKKYIPEIIEAVDADGQEMWYFALIYADRHKDYETSRDQGLVDIKQNDKGELFVYVCDEKCGQVIDSGHGAPAPRSRIRQDRSRRKNVPADYRPAQTPQYRWARIPVR